MDKLLEDQLDRLGIHPTGLGKYCFSVPIKGYPDSLAKLYLAIAKMAAVIERNSRPESVDILWEGVRMLRGMKQKYDTNKTPTFTREIRGDKYLVPSTEYTRV